MTNTPISNSQFLFDYFSGITYRSFLFFLLFYTNIVSSQTNVPLDWQLTDSLFKSRAYPLVIDQANQIIAADNNPLDQAKAMVWKGRSELRTGQFQAAVETLQQAIVTFGTPSDSLNLVYKAFAYNDMGSASSRLGKNKKALNSFEEALQIRLKVLGPQHNDVAGTYNNMSNIFIDNGAYNQALELINKALNIRQKILGEDHISLSSSYYKLGLIYLNKGYYEKAIKQTKIALKMREAAYGKEHPQIINTLNLMGAIYTKKEDYHRGLDYFQQSYNLSRKVLGDEHFATIGATKNIGVAYLELKQLDSAYVYLLKDLETIAAIFGVENETNSRAYNNLGILEMHRNNFEIAFDWFQKAKKLNIEIFGDNAPLLVENNNNLGLLFSKQHQWKEAILSHEKAITIAQQIWGQQHPRIADAYDGISTAYSQQKNVAKAIEYSQKAEQALFPAGTDATDYDAALSLGHLSNIYRNRANTYFKAWTDGKEAHHAEAALATVLQADQLLKYRRVSYKKTETQFRINQENAEIHELGLKIITETSTKNNDQQKLQQALNLMESSKMQQFLNTLRTNTEQLTFIGLPDSLIELQDAYQADLSQYEQQLFESKQDSLNQILKTKIFETKENYFALLEDLEKKYPDYYNLKYNTKTIDIAAARRLLPNQQTAIIEYFLGDSSLFSLVITKDDTFLSEHENVLSLKEDLKQLLTLLRQPKSPADLKKYTATLSKTLLEQALSQLPPNINQLIIIPDNALGYLPFETLYSPSNPPENPTFLLQKYQISYAYSASLLAQQQTIKQQPHEKLFAGFAPDYSETADMDFSSSEQQDIGYLVRSGQYQLPGAVHEVNQIAALLEGDAYTKEQATEAIFKNQANHYQILHLSMHSLFNDQEPLYSKLLFTPPTDSLEDGFLYATELYNMQLNADLAVLSACNTGFGKIEQGEGIMSLSRAFTYTGVPATIMSLWKVPDQATAQIMVAFYRYLKAGQTKDAALRQAKLDYLNSTVEPDQKHPYYWAGLVAVGDMRALGKEESSWLWWGLLGLFIFVGGVFFLKRK